MPERPASHVVADRAVNAVMGILVRAGHAVEVVKSDYGEDLLVQTAHSGQMDASRIWIQVKGTTKVERHKTSDGNYRLRFPRDQVMRWIRSLDTVLVVLWDVSNDEGWYAFPATSVDQIETLLQKSVRVRLLARDRLDKVSVTHLVWLSRIEHYVDLFLRSNWSDQGARERGVEGHQSLGRLIAFEFLQVLGLVGDSERVMRIRTTVHERFNRNCELIIEKMHNPSETVDRRQMEEEAPVVFRRAAILTLVDLGTALTGRGMPDIVVAECADPLITVLRMQEILTRALDESFPPSANASSEP